MTKTKSNLNEQQQFNEFLISQLRRLAFASGSQLSDGLVKKFKVNPEYARKIVQRAALSRAIKSSKPYTFGKGQFIYLMPNNELELNHVMDVCEKFRPPMYRLLKHLVSNDGILSKYEAMKIVASPKAPSSTKVETLDDMLKVLGRMEFAYEQNDNRGINYIILKKDFNRLNPLEESELMNDHYNKMVIDCSLIPDVIRWMSKINLIDSAISQPIYRNKKMPAIGASHNNLLWDVFTYTKTTGINEIVGSKADTTEKQTLVVMDIVFSEAYSDIHLDGFYNRIQINRNAVKGSKRKILPIVVYKECSDFVLNKMRKLGFLAFDIGSIFGARIYTVLQKLNEMNSLFTSGLDLEHTIEEILGEIKSAGQEDALKDLKGVLFEAMMYPVISKLFPEARIERNRTLTISNSKGEKEYYEYDCIVHSSRPKELVVVELKGYQSNAAIPVGDTDKKSTLKWFFRRTLPFAGRYYEREVGDGMVLRGLYMTSGVFWDEAQAWLEKMNKTKIKPKLYNVAYGRNDLIELLKERNFDTEVRIIEKFYTKED